MKISEIDLLFAACDARSATESELETVIIERLLVQAMLVNICAEFEWTIKEVINERGFVLRDSNVCSYDIKYSKQRIRSASPRYMKGVMSDFGEAAKKLFAKRRDGNHKAWMAYKSILSNRNSVAHRNEANSSVQMTMRELKAFYDTAHEVLDWFREALHVCNPSADLRWKDD